MGMTVQDALKQALTIFVTDAVAAAEAALPKLLPGLPGALLAEALSLPPVQAELNKLEAEGVDLLAAAVGKGMDALKALILSHVHGKLHDFLQKEFETPLPSLKIQPDELAAMIKLIEQGKFRQALGLA